MNATPQKTKLPGNNPWSWILLSAIIPIVVAAIAGYRWYVDRTDFKRVTKQFIQRQNTVMAYDAVEIATGFSDLLEKAARDVQTLALIIPNESNFIQFYESQMGTYTQFTGENSGIQSPLHFYNRISLFRPNGDLWISVADGNVTRQLKNLRFCKYRELCDEELIEKALKLRVGELVYGKLVRFFSPEGTPEIDKGAGLSVAYRSPNGIFFVQIDYRHLRDHLTSSSFPYDPKKNLIEAYQKGNYIFFVDDKNDIITHPHYWKAAGIDPVNGQWVSPMKDDSDAGRHPINISLYERGVLKEYFHRLMNLSFKQKGVDIFSAPNLAGTSRILSVAPILLDRGQFANSGVFGHVIIACNTEYFEEPQTVIVPYY